MKTFTLVLDKGTIDVQAIEIVIPGWEEYKFILHRNITLDNTEGDWFNITEVSTGRCLSLNADSDVIDLMNDVEHKLKRLGRLKVTKAFNNNSNKLNP